MPRFADLRNAARAIRRMPGVAGVVIASVGIGIGANTAVFTWVQARVLQPLPAVPDSHQLQLIEPQGENGSFPGMSWREFGDLQERLPSFQHVIAFRTTPLNVGVGTQLERAFGFFVSGNYFSGLGLHAAAGRLIDPADAARPGGESVIVISHEFWQARLAGAPDVIGRTVRVNDRPLTVVGVAPRGFRGTIMGVVFDLWMPATLAPVLVDGSNELTAREVRAYSAIGRLHAGVTPGRAQAELTAAMQDLARAYPSTNASVQGAVLPIWQAPRGPQRFLTSAIVILQGVMLLVLLAVCGNTANLLLARASTRRQEISIRLALGAGRWRIVRLLMTEHLVLGLLGAGFGAVAAMWGTEALRAVPLPSPAGVTIRFDSAVDAVSVGFAMALGVMSSLLFGLPPALHLARLTPNRALRSGTSPGGRSVTRDVLMAVQVALALVVLVVAALFVRNFDDTKRTDPGFRREGVLLAAYDLRGRNRGVDSQRSAEFARRLLDEVRRLPAVESAALATSVPLDIHGLPTRAFALEGRARPDGTLDQAVTNTVTPGYFATMQIPLRAGADFTSLDDTATAPQAIVNEEFVRQYLGDAWPIGRRLDASGRPYILTGVVANSLSNAFGEPPTPAIYLSLRDRPSPSTEVHVRTRDGQELDVAPEIRKVVAGLDASLPLYNVRTLEQHVDQNLVFRRIPARMFVVLGPLLLALAAIGIFGVVAYAVAQRRSEIGLRLALGATGGRVVAALMIDTLRVIALGAAAGWAVAIMIDRDVASGGASSAPIVIGVPLVLFAVAVVACWLPARRASRVDPLTALRPE